MHSEPLAQAAKTSCTNFTTEASGDLMHMYG